MSSGLLNPIDAAHFGDGLPNYYSHIVSLFEKRKVFSYVADFARLALHVVRPSDPPVRISPIDSGNPPQLTPDPHQALRTDLLSRLFYASIQTSRYDEAYSALSRYTDTALQHSALTTLITSMIAASQTPHLIRVPFANNPSLHHHLDTTLASLAAKTIDLEHGPPYHTALYAWRLARNDFRGAAAVLHQRLQRLQASTNANSTSSASAASTVDVDPSSASLANAQTQTQPVLNAYLALINVLACVEKSQAWILAEGAGEEEGRRRKVVTLDDVRADYQAELDRVAAIESGRFAFVGDGGEMDVL